MKEEDASNLVKFIYTGSASFTKENSEKFRKIAYTFGVPVTIEPDYYPSTQPEAPQCQTSTKQTTSKEITLKNDPDKQQSTKQNLEQSLERSLRQKRNIDYSLNKLQSCDNKNLCKYCNFEFKDIREHKKKCRISVIMETKPFRCQACMKFFKKKATLLKHKQKFHVKSELNDQMKME